MNRLIILCATVFYFASANIANAADCPPPFDPQVAVQSSSQLTSSVTNNCNGVSAPTKPTNFSGTASNGDGVISLTWSASGSFDNTGYYELRQNNEGLIAEPSRNSTSTTINVTSDGTYSFELRACNMNINTAQSVCSATAYSNSIVVDFAPAKPTVPSNLSYPDKDYDGTVNIEWTASTGFDSSGLYELQRSHNGGAYFHVISPQSNQTSFLYTNIPDGDNTIRLRACNEDTANGKSCSAWATGSNLNVELITETTLNVTTCDIPQQVFATSCDATVEWSGPTTPLGEEPGVDLPPCVDLGNSRIGCAVANVETVSITLGAHEFTLESVEDTPQIYKTVNVNIDWADYTPLFDHDSTTHNTITGDFDGNGEDDSYFQPLLEAAEGGIMPTVSNGYFNDTFHKSWTNAHPDISAIEDWSEESYGVYSGNFTSEPGDELLMLGTKQIILLHGDIITPITIFQPVRNAIVSWNASNVASHTEFEFDANPADFVVHVGDLDSDVYDEIFLQAKSSGGTSYILDHTGSLIQTITNGYRNVEWSAASYDLEIVNGAIVMTALKSADDDNIAYTGSAGSITSLDVAVTKPTLSGTSQKYVFEGLEYRFVPTITNSISDLTYSATGMPSWMSIDPINGELSGTPTNQDSNLFHTITISVHENKTHTIDVSMKVSIEVVESFTLPETGYTVYESNHGTIYLVSDNGVDVFKLVEDQGINILIKTDLNDFNNSGSTLTTEYTISFEDTNYDGYIDLVLVPSNGSSLDQIIIGSISNTGHQISIGSTIREGLDHGPSTLPTAPANPLEGLDLNTEVVGSLPANFSVKPSGSASYQVPIIVAPGAGGLVPNINLNYDSLSGNGIMGVGWRLGGIPAIKYCSPELTGAHEVTDGSFCLNGNKLVLSDEANRYETEDNSSLNVVKGSFTQDQEELVEYIEYKTDGSRIIYREIKNGYYPAYRRVDASGNYIEMVYSEYVYDLANFKVEKILYTGNENTNTLPSNSIVFDYEGRDDYVSRTIRGFTGGISSRISSITSYVNTDSEGLNGEELRTYNLRYDDYASITGRSLLRGITACRETSCLPETSFDWNEGVQEFADKYKFDDGGSSRYHDSNYGHTWGYKFLDFDGDGVVDYWKNKNDSGDSNDDLIVIKGGDTFEQLEVRNNFLTQTTRRSMQLIDYNLDGKEDLIYARDGFWHIILAKKISETRFHDFDNPINTGIPYQVNTLGDVVNRTVNVADYNGDQYPDIAYIHNNHVWVRYNNKVTDIYASPRQDLFSNATIFYAAEYGQLSCLATQTCDVDDQYTKTALQTFFANFGDRFKAVSNGPGKKPSIITGMPYVGFNQDLGNKGKWYIANDWFNSVELGEYDLEDKSIQDDTTYTMPTIHTPDLNGDGIEDIFYVKQVNDEITLFHCTRTNNLSCTVSQSPISMKNYADDHDDFDNLNFHFADYNYDGRKDLIHGSVHNGNTYVRYNEGSSFSASVQIPVSSTSDKIERVMDVNGDGILDYAYHHGRLHHELGTSQKHDLIEGINDGSTLRRQIQYSKNVHVMDNDANEFNWEFGRPISDLRSPTYRVSSTFKRSTMVNTEVQFCDFIGGGNSEPGECYLDFANTYDGTGFSEWLSFQYKGLKWQGGRGVLGFREVIVTDHVNDKTITTEYRQDFPFTGKMTSTTTVIGVVGDQTVETVELEYAKNSDGPVYVTSSTTSKTENNLQLSTSVVTTPNVDEFGLPTEPVTTVLTDHVNNTTFTSVDDFGFTLHNLHYGGRLTSKVTSLTRQGEPSIVQSSEYDYFANGLLWKQITDPSNYVGSSSADESQQSYGLTMTYERDLYGNVLSTTTTDGDQITRKESVTYDSLNRYPITKTIYPNYQESNSEEGAITTSTQYHPIFGTKISETSANGQVSHFGYSTLGRLNFESSPNGTYVTTEKVYCDGDSECPEDALYKEETILSNGPDTVAYFDKRGQKVKEKTESLSCYNPDGISDTCSGTTVDWVYTTYLYNDKGLLIYQSRPHFENEIGEIDYAANFRGEIITTVPTGWASYEYDYQNRVTDEYRFDRSHWQTSYNGFSVTITDPDGRSTTKIQNAFGEVILMTDADLNEVSYTYDSLGSLRLLSRQSSSISGGGTTIDTVIVNDHLGQKLSMTDPDKGTVLYRYNAFGEIVWQQDNKGQVSEFEYDSAGRVVDFKSYSDYQNSTLDQHTKSYYDLAENGLGLLQSEEDLVNGITKSYVYNVMSQVTRETTTLASGQAFYGDYVYDDLFRVKDTYDASGEFAGVNYEYHDDYLVEKTDLRSGRTIWQFVESDSAGNAIAYLNGNGVLNKKSYNLERGLLNLITATNRSMNNLQYDELRFNYLGNLEYRNDDIEGMVETFSYDNINRLDDWTISFGSNQDVFNDINYDHLGNISFKQGMGSYQYGQTQCGRQAGPHAITTLVTDNGNKAYCYDANGNMVSGGGRSDIQYNTNDKPVSILTDSGHQIAYHYSLGGGRFKRVDTATDNSVKETLYIGNVEFIKEDGLLTKVLRHMDAVAVETRTVTTGAYSLEFLHRDHLGSVELITDLDGERVAKFSYDPWGQRRDINNYTQIGILDSLDLALSYAVEDFRRGYTGHEHIDEAGLIHMNGRVYDPRLGRFLSADPFVKSAENLQTFNRYAYVQNNPLNAVDPSGYTDWYLGLSFGANGFGVDFGYSDGNSSWEYSGSNDYWEMDNQEEDELDFSPNRQQEFAYDRYSWLASVEVDSVDTNGGTLLKPGSSAKGKNDTTSGEFDASIPSSVKIAPNTIDLSHLNSDFNELWGKSFPNGKATEAGGTLIVGATGKVYIINKGMGSSGDFAPNLKMPSRRFKLAGVFHTHPYDSGDTGISLSGGDAAYLINSKQSLIIAQSGSEQFMLLRTKESPKSVNFSFLNDSQNKRVASLVAGGETFRQATQKSTYETAQKYNLAYYVGVKGVFTKKN